MAYTYEYPRPALTVDCIIFGLDKKNLKVLLIKRGLEPFAGKWALPGGFVDMEEDLHQAALRELEEETGVKDIFIEQLYTFGKQGRDPRGRVVSVAYYALVNLGEHPINASSDADEAAWFEIDQLPPLAFDHEEIIDIAIKRLKGKVVYLDFWASWCKPCVKSFPWMQAMKTKYQDLGLEVVAINLDKNREQADDFLKKVEVDFIIAYDPAGNSAKTYELKGMPTSYLIGRDGKIYATHIGFREIDKPKLEQAIQKLLRQ